MAAAQQIEHSTRESSRELFSRTTLTQHQNLPFLLFHIQEGLYAISSAVVREIAKIPQVVSVPAAPPEVRGVINLRGKVIKLIDLRVKLGLRPLRADLDVLVQLLKDREQDHRNWLAELEACMCERRPFKLTRDPHKCKFGLWYDQFKTMDKLLGMTLPAMDAPHKAIHATADTALSRAETGDFEGGMELIQQRRSQELAGLIKLFEESRRILSERQHEVAIVLARGEHRLAFSADMVESVEHIPQENVEPMPAMLAALDNGAGCRVAKRTKPSQTILILRDDFLFSSAGMD